ncbi:MAG: hypothetical protein R2748_04740 [Bryobacterales bacterium]
MTDLGETELGEKVRMNRRAAGVRSVDLCEHYQPRSDGRGKIDRDRFSDYGALQAHHNPKTIRDSDSYFDHKRSALTSSADRQAAVIKKSVKVFHIETVVNNQMFDPRMAFFRKNEDHWNIFDKAVGGFARKALSVLPRKIKREILFAVPAPYDLIAVHAGDTWATHRHTLAYCYQQYCVPIEGQADVAVFGVPFVSPLQRLESFARAGDGVGVSVQHVSRHARRQEERRHDRDPPVVQRVRESITRPTTSSFTASFQKRPTHLTRENTRRSLRRARSTSNSTAGASPITGYTRFICGTGGRTAAHTSAKDLRGRRRPALSRDHGLGHSFVHGGGARGWRAPTSGEPSVTHVHIPPINMVDVSGTPQTV